MSNDNAIAKQASTIDMKRYKRIEQNRRRDARYRLLAAILNASENNELCNTLYDDEKLNSIREDIRTTVNDWMIELSKELCDEQR